MPAFDRLWQVRPGGHNSGKIRGILTGVGGQMAGNG
jgi:hypothetical protein